MTITMIDDGKVMEALQEGKKLVCIDFKEEVYNLCSDMLIGTLQERIQSECCKFFAVEETIETANE